ncbi:hypothetical protein QFC19_002658 [Naganishia cerealis]|uniref:Uncharacterized protein n=1 Tax=Naganishia cerealis TaxID=610337 RepID=A0ACC2W9C8_9TREE|nr:hypothetical protein QFC19_002658 [Naganishia cerealis]
MSSGRQPEDLLSLSLSLSQPLPTDHYAPPSFGLNKIMAGLDPDSRPTSQLGRIATPGTSGDDGKSGSGSGATSNSSGADGSDKKKAKKKKKKKAGEVLPEIIPEDDDIAGLACPQPVSPVKSSLVRSEIIPIPNSLGSPVKPRSPSIHSRSEKWLRESTPEAENIEKESITVDPWETRWSDARTNELDRGDVAPMGSFPSENESATLSTEAVPTEMSSQTSPRLATPMQVRRPAPTLFDEFPALMNIPNLIPSGLGISAVPLPSLSDVKAAGRATAMAGIALVETVKDEYLTRIRGEIGAVQSSGKEQINRRRNSRSMKGKNHKSPYRISKRDSPPHRSGSDVSSDSDNAIGEAESSSGLPGDGSEDNLEGDSDDDEVLIELDEAEGMTESWKGLKGQPSEAALGHGWTNWRSCKWEHVNFLDSGEERYVDFDLASRYGVAQ